MLEVVLDALVIVLVSLVFVAFAVLHVCFVEDDYEELLSTSRPKKFKRTLH